MTSNSFHLALNTEGGEGDKTTSILIVLWFILIEAYRYPSTDKIIGTWYPSLYITDQTINKQIIKLQTGGSHVCHSSTRNVVSSWLCLLSLVCYRLIFCYVFMLFDFKKKKLKNGKL